MNGTRSTTAACSASPAAATTPGIAAGAASALSAGPRPLAGTAATGTVESITAPTQPGEGLYHICTTHPFAVDGDCMAGCVSYCGIEAAEVYDVQPLNTATPAPDDCIVCLDLFEQACPE